MKKMLLILALAKISFANAQKGTILVGGNIGYSSSNRDFLTSNEKYRDFGFSPKVGYQFHDNWTVGGEFSIGSSRTEIEGRMTGKANNFKAGAFLRYSVPLTETFSVFADLGAGFQNQKRTVSSVDAENEFKGDGFYTAITPALFINMKKGFGLNFSIGGIGYQTWSFDDEGQENKEFNFNFGKTVNIGISKNF